MFYSQKQSIMPIAAQCVKTKKILHIIDHMGLGGAQDILAKLAQGQANRTITHEILVLHGQGFRADTVEHLDTPVRILAESKRNLPLILLKLVAHISRYDYDILHLHLETSSFLGTYLALILSGKPVIVTGYSLKQQYPWPRFHVFTLIAPFVSSFVWLWHNNRDLQSVGVNKKKVRVIPIGIDVSHAEPQRHTEARTALCTQYGIEPVRPLLLSVARLAANRHIHLLIEAMIAIVTACPDAVLLMVGEGEEREHLEAMIRQHGIERNVIFAGVRMDVWNLYPGCDIYLSSSGQCDTGVAALQAMACARPVVTYTIASMVPATCMCADQGQFVQARDPRAMANATLELLQHPERAQALGEAARQKVLAQYSLGSMLQSYNDLYVQYLNIRG